MVGQFVRAVRARAGTPSDAQGETLAFLERAGPVSIAALADGRGVKHQSMRLVTARLEAERRREDAERESADAETQLAEAAETLTRLQLRVRARPSPGR